MITIKRIPSPMFLIGDDGNLYTEYELRSLMLDVAVARISLEEPLKVKQVGLDVVSHIRLDGIMTVDLPGLGLLSDLTIRLLRFQQN